MVENRSSNLLDRLLSAPNDSPQKAIFVILAVCLFASVLVTTSSVLLRPLQQENAERARAAQLAGVLTGESEAVEPTIKALVIDLETGLPDETLDPATFDARAAENDPATSIAISPDRDVATIGRRARHAVVHFLYRNGELDLIVLPVHGQGFASTLFGYLGLSGDTQEVVGLTFYEHGETPGLGALIEHPAWLDQWRGKRVWSVLGEPALGVADGAVDPTSMEARHLVDGLTGATWTGRGVTNLLRFWLGEDGYGPLLRNIRNRKVR
jgi:Na+-transporting NADH:ubiquinone oxidoreductase subunit C